MSLVMLATVDYLLEKIQPYDKNYPHEKPSNYVSEKMRRVRIWFGGMCSKCQETENLEFAHILKTNLSGQGRGQNKRLCNILRYPASYVLMCHTHHKEHDDQDIPAIPNLFGIKLKEFVEC